MIKKTNFAECVLVLDGVRTNNSGKIFCSENSTSQTEGLAEYSSRAVTRSSIKILERATFQE